MYMLIGMELFAFKVKFNPITNAVDFGPNGIYPQSNFNTPLRAFLSVFIIFAADDWSNIFYDHYRATDPISTSIYFVSLLIIGQFILLNLFIAIMIENFDELSIRVDIMNKFNSI